MSLKSTLKRELKSRKLKLEDLNKKQNKEAKRQILGVLVRQGLLDKKSKTQLGKDIRATGVKVNNTLFRDLYDSFAISPKKVNPANQKKSTKPRVKNVPDLGGKGAGKYLYIATTYCIHSGLKNKRTNKFKTLPKSAIPLGFLKKYNFQSEIGLWSDELLPRNKIDTLFLNEFWGDDTVFNSDLTGSDYNNILTSVNIEIIAFKYARVLKSN